jgi:hypothetical protein
MGPVIGLGLPVAGFAAGGAGLTSFYVIGFELGPWQEYLAQELTPDYMLPEDAQPIQVSWIRISEILILPDFAAELEQAPATWINLNFQWQSDSQYDWPGADEDSVYEARVSSGNTSPPASNVNSGRTACWGCRR